MAATLNCYQMFSDIQTQKMAKLVVVRMLLVHEKGESDSLTLKSTSPMQWYSGGSQHGPFVIASH